MTIYPLVVPGHPSREERLANTEPNYPPQEAPLTNDQLNELRAKAQARPQHHTHSAANAERSAMLARETEARRQEQLKREAEEKK
jgi:hypothetical protein